MPNRLMKISDIKANPNNPRIIKDDKFKKLVESVKSFPEMLELRPIVVNKDMIILGGNMRYKACKEAWIKEIPVIVADNLTEEQEREFLIKDNVSGGEWDWDILANEWDKEELEEWGLDVTFETVEPTAEEDDFDATPPEEPITVLWDLYEIWEHRLLCGDSTDIVQVEKLMNGEKAELLFTSPPYSDMREYNGWKDLSVWNIKEFISSFWPSCEYQAINLWIQRKENNIIQYWDDYIKEAKEFWYLFLAWNVWHKTWVSIWQQSSFIPIYHEWIFVFWNKFKDINKTWDRKKEISKRTTRSRRQADWSMKVSSIWLQEERKEMESVFKSNTELWAIRKEHPATFPVELPEEYITAITNSWDIIAEPFCWSWSTMVASHQLKRKCYWMELDPKYCDVIVNRMQKLDPSLVIKRNWVPYTISNVTVK